ncbi:MAG: phage terminase large subunit [Deltaproteobacteria bacterium]|uniref:Phage terminase large subunit n=1 Tax=Candidatus Zymogenus saltonus TaxID=2844893 RepID=A0A9D8KIM6_9DELT|nr:phage terminase large subunit [Candidatus Zymogenus saltonus]
MTAREIHLEERYVPHSKQIEAHTAKERYVLYGGAMGGGKSVFLVNEAIQLSLDHPGNVGLLCRWELESLRRTTLMTLEEYLPEELIRRHHKTEKYYELINGSIIFYGGLKPSSESIGEQRIRSMKLGWFAIDEATEIPKKYFHTLQTRLRHKVNGEPVRYKGLLASNPEPGWVREDFIEKKLSDNIFIPALPIDNPYLPDDYVESLRRNLPEELVKKYLDGDWNVMEGENYIFPYKYIRAAVERTRERGKPVQAGLDVARMGGDYNVLAVRFGFKVEILYTARFQKETRTAGEVALLLDHIEERGHGRIPVNVDIPGVGGGVHDPLEEMGYDVHEFQPGGSAREPERYINRKAEAAFSFRTLLVEEEIDIPDDPELVSQLAGIKYDIRSDKRLKVESKEEMKKRGMKSPDKADAVIMAFYDVKKSTFRIEVV